ncbi:Spermidine N(1)-acetyltransferase [bacterium HR15]|nr:Spermidine N(1)-acetyltransferase [bacterium HR15]
MAYGWTGEKVRLVPLDQEKHLPNALLWLNDPDITQWTLRGDFPLSRLAEEEWFKHTMSHTNREVVFAIETLEGEHIGFTGIHQIDWRHGTAITGTIIGRKDLWRRGFGTDAVKVRTRYAFEVLGLRMLLSEVMAENVASMRMLLKVGYREVGRIPRRYWKRGAYRDVVLLVMERAL